MGIYIVFCVYRRSYLLWSPVIGKERKKREVKYGGGGRTHLLLDLHHLTIDQTSISLSRQSAVTTPAINININSRDTCNNCSWALNMYEYVRCFQTRQVGRGEQETETDKTRHLHHHGYQKAKNNACKKVWAYAAYKKMPWPLIGSNARGRGGVLSYIFSDDPFTLGTTAVAVPL